MKKIISFVIMFSLILSLSGCSENKPDKVVVPFCNALKAYDFSTASSYMENSDDFIDTFDDYVEEEDPFSEQLMIYLKDNAGKMTYSLGEMQIKDDTAVVPVSFTYIDASTVVTAALGEYFPQALAMAFGDVGEEQMEELFQNIFEEKTKSIETNTTSISVNFTCVKVEGKWKISKFSNADATALSNVLTCNIVRALENFDDTFDESESDDAADNTVWHDVPLGQETELATVKIKITGYEERQELTGEYMEPDVAQNGTKYIVLNVAIENTTKDGISFDNDLLLTDSQGRRYEAYDNAMWYYDETFSYTNLAPNILQEGVFVYNVPSDSSDCFLSVLKEGTNDGYRLYLTE